MMASKKILVEILNKSGPIPNICSIIAHNPDIVLFIIMNNPKGELTEKFDENLNRIIHWNDSNLPAFFEFDENYELKHPPANGIGVEIQSIYLDNLVDESARIEHKLRALSDNISSCEIILDVSSGRKEDVANLTRMKFSPEIKISIWYTDSNTGESVEIGGESKQIDGKVLDQITSFWLEGFPVIDSVGIYNKSEINLQLVTDFLDCFEQIAREESEPEDKIRALENILETNGIKMEYLAIQDFFISEHNQFRINYLDNPEGSFVISANLFSKESGIWLEQIAAIAALSEWDVDRAYVGLLLVSSNRQKRMQSMKKMLRYERQKMGVIWSKMMALGLISNEFSDISQILKYPSLFLDYICDQWKNLTPELQAVLLTQAAERELDVLAEGIIDTLFVECGLTPNETTVPIKTSQIASLVHSTSLRGYNLSFYCHSNIDFSMGRTGSRIFVCSWAQLRNKSRLLELDVQPIIYSD